jgi:hypothetical protein
VYSSHVQVIDAVDAMATVIGILDRDRRRCATVPITVPVSPQAHTADSLNRCAWFGHGEDDHLSSVTGLLIPALHTTLSRAQGHELEYIHIRLMDIIATISGSSVNQTKSLESLPEHGNQANPYIYFGSRQFNHH